MTTTMISPEIVVFDTDMAGLQAWQSSLRLPFMTFALGTGPQVTASRDLDAMWLTPMQAERFGAMPPFPLHVALVLATPASDVQKGFPPFIVTGVAVANDDPKDPQWQLRLVMTSLLRAIRDACARGQTIRRVGMLPEHLFMDRLSAEEVGAIVKAAYEKQ